MTLRQAHDGALLTAADIILIRQVLCTCADVLTWAGQHAGPDYQQALADMSQDRGLSRAPGALAGQAALAIDVLDFAAPAPGRTS
jgi:hypothetical protein